LFDDRFRIYSYIVKRSGALALSKDKYPTPESEEAVCRRIDALHTRRGSLYEDAIEILKGISPVAWRNVNLIGNFDFTTGTSPVDIEALAERYENPDFWRRSLQEAEDDVGILD